ncbi:MAG: hypothetical protein I3J02_07435 [Prevotella sp.]|nr:hypothetical protein [Prevotella sp.]
MKKILIMAAALYSSTMQLLAAPGDTISLDEKWLFRLVRNETSIPRNFESTRFNDTQWTFQTVPGVWRVPTSWLRNDYVGTYRGWIKMPPAYAGRRIFLHLGLTTASTSVYVNGVKIGQTALDRAQTEFEITSNVNIGQRNLFVFQMPHYDEGEDASNTYGKSGITSHCFIYALNNGQQQDLGPEIGKAKAGVKVASRHSFQLAEGYFDTPKVMQKDIEQMKALGFGAITYNKLSSDPEFIAYAKEQGMEVVSDPPLTSAPLIDEQGNYTMEVYNLLPDTKYNFRKEIEEGEGRADAAVHKAKPKKKESNAVLTIWDTPYSITFDKYSGLISSYSQNGVTVFSGGGTVMPNNKTTLVNLTSTKPNRNNGTKVTAVYDVAGAGQVTWVYEISNNGVLRISTKGQQDILVTLSSRLSATEYLAQDFSQDVSLLEIPEYRPRVYWMKQRDNVGNGVEVIGERPFTAVQTSKSGQLLIQHGGKDFNLRFLPVAR